MYPSLSSADQAVFDVNIRVIVAAFAPLSAGTLVFIFLHLSVHLPPPSLDAQSSHEGMMRHIEHVAYSHPTDICDLCDLLFGSDRTKPLRNVMREMQTIRTRLEALALYIDFAKALDPPSYAPSS
ncbi:hypothetical protein HMN09_00182400 [Mycena chlorophos]|uniref:Uncharacterized protein n=1 Tax=Mycena chlorophos TaxID=658473 RepID=A0A8H6WKP3_MYCCL|nr:hypothetical protein HMN09_00182400 [Mycena chlorophos]